MADVKAVRRLPGGSNAVEIEHDGRTWIGAVEKDGRVRFEIPEAVSAAARTQRLRVIISGTHEPPLVRHVAGTTFFALDALGDPYIATVTHVQNRDGSTSWNAVDFAGRILPHDVRQVVVQQQMTRDLADREKAKALAGPLNVVHRDYPIVEPPVPDDGVIVSHLTGMTFLAQHRSVTFVATYGRGHKRDGYFVEAERRPLPIPVLNALADAVWARQPPFQRRGHNAA
ncbi:hypothetical protein [Lichenifustis flavocetrariae]|uniref:Uncharacterized protein n=1 Tax=Lichenifustis flavocetrariae TaxID=2949735 RepID=A0AA42CMZ5_9HYPH|nr:hypothetical protein [Lichenifustis flavocetrariae]MCW6512121.1 hypothetical protein [Lichenifustis flavocetrariae]